MNTSITDTMRIRHIASVPSTDDLPTVIRKHCLTNKKFNRINGGILALPINAYGNLLTFYPHCGVYINPLYQGSEGYIASLHMYAIDFIILQTTTDTIAIYSISDKGK